VNPSQAWQWLSKPIQPLLSQIASGSAAQRLKPRK
jgi:hypothetical protein